jgi:hypothetical protein
VAPWLYKWPDFLEPAEELLKAVVIEAGTRLEKGCIATVAESRAQSHAGADAFALCFWGAIPNDLAIFGCATNNDRFAGKVRPLESFEADEKMRDEDTAHSHGSFPFRRIEKELVRLFYEFRE